LDEFYKSTDLKRVLLGLIKKLKFLPPPLYVRAYYEYYTGKKLRLNAPVEFNEKVQWLKVYYRDPRLNQLVDKYSVRRYVEEKVGQKYLNELLGVYDNAREVDFDALPAQFVIKGVHGCHFNLIVPDKTELKPMKSRLLLHKWMSKNQYYRGGLEWAYKDVKPRLIAEKYLEEMGRKVINDYKFFCFGGTPRFLQIDLDRGEMDYRCYYDLTWSKLPFTTEKNTFFEGEVPKPDNFDEMIEVATRLADDFPFVRVDLYNIKGQVLFGEMTFYPADGRKEFVPDEFNTIIGNYLVLPDPA
jgi:hypothetical protein